MVITKFEWRWYPLRNCGDCPSHTGTHCRRENREFTDEELKAKWYGFPAWCQLLTQEEMNEGELEAT